MSNQAVDLAPFAFDFKLGKERLGYLKDMLNKELQAIGYARMTRWID